MCVRGECFQVSSSVSNICKQVHDDMQNAFQSKSMWHTSPAACRRVTVNYSSTTPCLGNRVWVNQWEPPSAWRMLQSGEDERWLLQRRHGGPSKNWVVRKSPYARPPHHTQPWRAPPVLPATPSKIKTIPVPSAGCAVGTTTWLRSAHTRTCQFRWIILCQRTECIF